MSKIYAQSPTVAWLYSGSVAASAVLSSGTVPCSGYSRLIGMHWCAASSEAGSGLRISESADLGVTWDRQTDYVPIASSGSVFTASLAGNAIKIEYTAEDTTACLREYWRLMPI